MAEIVLLAVASAVFPTLLACVAIIISRPEPRWLLVAFYAGGLIASLVSGFILLSLFNGGDSALGSTSTTPHPGVSITGGVLALVFAWLMATARGRAILKRLRSGRERRHPKREHKPKHESVTTWAEQHLDHASMRVAFVIGAAIDLPGPFYILALGEISRGHYTRTEQVALVLLFNAIMFILIEAPLVGYVVNPKATQLRVGELSRWLNANGLRITGGLVGLFGVGLLVEGIYALVS